MRGEKKRRRRRRKRKKGKKRKEKCHHLSPNNSQYLNMESGGKRNIACVQKSHSSATEHTLVAVQNSLQSQGLNQQYNWKEKKIETKNLQHML